MLLRPLLPLAALLLSACAYTPVQKPVAGDDFRGNELGQSSANRTANLAMRDNLASLQTLLEKLYKRNPREWRKAGAADYPAAMRQVMAAIRNNTPMPTLRGQRSIAAMSAAFDPGFDGDRAGALIYGIGSMLVDAYGGRTELFLVHGLDAQQLANASHNLEVAAWMLNNRQINGGPVLLSNEIGSVRNLSFEREFGKMMARLDLLAELSDEKLRRSAIDFGQSLIAGPFLQFLPVSAVAQAAAP